jgi:hypothetical protein
MNPLLPILNEYLVYDEEVESEEAWEARVEADAEWSRWIERFRVALSEEEEEDGAE